MSNLLRINIPYFEGVNTIVEHNISKKVEPELMENARSVKIGSIEKRKGYTALGNDIGATANYGLFYFENTTSMKSVYRVSNVAASYDKISGAVAAPALVVGANGGGGQSAWAFGFVAGYTGNIGGLYLQKRANSGTPTGNFIVELRTNNAGVPSATVLVTATIALATWNGYATATDLFIPLPYYLTATTTYWVVLRNSATEAGSDAFQVSSAADDGTGANTTYSADGGGTWADSASSVYMKILRSTPVPAIYYLGSTSLWTVLADAGINLSAADMTTTIAENCCFLVNGTDVNRYIGTNGTTVTTASTWATTNHLYNSPKAFLINYYKDKLYTADYYLGSTRVKNGVAFSSRPVGLVSLVSGDFALGVTSIDVTDTKYIYTTDSLDVIRGGIKITTIAVTAKTEYSLTVTATGAAIKSSDELWVANTYDGTAPMVFRWASVASGTSNKRYDTFKMAGGSNSSINLLTNIGDVMAISNKDSFMTWNDSALTSYDSGVGCISKRGYVKVNNILFFMHYTGVYATSGGEPKLVSSKVQDYIDYATRANLEACAAGKKGLNIFFYIGNVTLKNSDESDGRTLTDVVLEYNLKQENWYIHTGIPASQFATYVETSDSDDIIFTNKTDYKVYEFLKGYTDNGNAIPFSIMTSAITLNNEFEKISNPRFFILETEAGNTLKCFVSLDNEPLYELKTSMNKGCARIAITPRDYDDEYARCRTIKLAVKEYSAGLCKISRMSLIYSQGQEYEEQRM